MTVTKRARQLERLARRVSLVADEMAKEGQPESDAVSLSAVNILLASERLLIRVYGKPQ